MKREIQLYQNKWQPNFNFEKLDCDFDFYQINCEMKNKEFYQKFVKIGATFSEISNSYRGSYEEQSFVMTKKGAFNSERLDALCHFFAPIEVQIKKIASKSVNVPSDGFKHSIDYRPLLALQLGLLPLYSKRHGMTQIDGNCYFFMPKKNKKWHYKNHIIGLGIILENDGRFRTSAKTFALLNEDNRKNARQFFRWDADTSCLKQVTQIKEQNQPYYTDCAVAHTAAQVNYLDLRSQTHFSQTRMGILDLFMQEIKTHFSQYVTLELVTMADIEYFRAKYVKKDHTKEYIDYFAGKTIYLVDQIKTATSQVFMQKLYDAVTNFPDFAQINFQKTAAVENGYNVVLIHNQEFYHSEKAKEKEQEDPYLFMKQGKIIQHITLEDFNYADDEGNFIRGPIYKLFQELILKDVNYKGQLNELTLLNYFKQQRGCDFAMYFEEEKDKYGLCWLKIDKTGKLTYQYFSPESFQTEPILKKLERLRKKRKNTSRNPKQVAGFIIKNDDQIAMICETQMSTISDFNYIKQVLEDTKRKEDSIRLGNLQKVVGDFLQQNPNHPKIQQGYEFLNQLTKLLKDNETATIGEIKGDYTLRGNPAIFKDINETVHEKLGYYIWPPLRTKEYEEMYGNLLDINLFCDEQKRKYYFVGIPKHQIKQAPIARTTRIRELVFPDTQSEFRFKEIQALFDIDIVKNGTLTVYPMPFKLMREYLKNEQRKGRQRSKN